MAVFIWKVTCGFFKKIYFRHLLRDKMHPNVLTCHTIVLCNRMFEHILSTPATINLSRQVTARYPGTVDKELALAFPKLLFAWESGTSDVANLSQRQKNHLGIGRQWSKPKHSLAPLHTQPAGAVSLQTYEMIPFHIGLSPAFPELSSRVIDAQRSHPMCEAARFFPVEVNFLASGST